MPLPLAIPLVMAGLSAAQTIGGVIQQNRARKDFEKQNENMPSLFDSRAYQTAKTSENMATRFAQEGLPEETMRFQEDMIGRSGAAALSSVSGLRGLQSVGGIATSLADQYRSLASMDANQRIANRDQMFAQRENVQGIEMNQAGREYGQALNMQAASLARMSAGQQNIQSGIDGLAGSGSMAYDVFNTPVEFGGLQKPR